MRESNQIPVRIVPTTKYSRILTYPVLDNFEARKRVRELLAAGVTEIRFSGRTLIDGVPVLGKGCVGIVVEAILDGIPVALKIRRHDADRASMVNEGRLLRLANSVDVGPRLVTATKNLLAMELFEGLPLFRWAESPRARNPRIVAGLLSRLLSSCFRLDSIGLDHGELSHAPKNVLVSDDAEPCIVDFESASAVRRAANVTSLLQYFVFGRISKMIPASRLFPERKMIVKSLSQYKQEPSVANFQNILKSLRLS